jgi:3' terminal RNA ribose 2'-O-methyltransferase Hen1
MLLTLTNRTRPARDLGYFLRKHPDRSQEFELPFGVAHVFYPTASDDVCTAALFLDIDPVTLVRGRVASSEGGLVEAYVNDRPYSASSFLSVAIARIFGAALNGRSDPPELADQKMDLEAVISCVRGAREDLTTRLFEPLGYRVTSTDVDVPDTVRAGSHRRVAIAASTTLQLLLNHIYVLVPVLDGSKHYWVGGEEVEKLFRFGKDWLPTHPDREFITKRYLQRAPSLARAAVARLAELDDSVGADAPQAPFAAEQEQRLERPLRLQDRRIASVVAAVHNVGAKSVVDVGCGEGDLIAAMARDSEIDRIVGTDVSARELERAKARLEHLTMASSRRERITLFQSSALYYDHRLNGADVVTLLEVVEHVEPDRLRTLERVIFGTNKPRNVIVTTPNREYNALFPSLATGRLRHSDHRFEWSRAEFAAWAESVASQHGYSVSFEPIGDVDGTHGAPTQMAVFRCV